MMAAAAATGAGISDATAVLLEALPFARRSRIADVGASPINPAPYAGLLAAGGCDVVGFEPNPQALAALERGAGPHETYLPHAVGDGRPAELKIYRAEGLTSLFDPDVAAMAALGRPGLARIDRREAVETVRLDSVAGLGPVDLLKIDIQGSERAAFIGAEAVLKGAVAIITEVRFFPLYRDEPMLGGVDSELRRQGFQLHRFLFQKARLMPSSQSGRLRPRQVADQLIDGDAVYLRDLRDMAAYDDQMLMHLALFASALFGSHSLVLTCLDALAARGAVAADLARRYVDALPAQLRKSGG